MPHRFSTALPSDFMGSGGHANVLNVQNVLQWNYFRQTAFRRVSEGSAGRKHWPMPNNLFLAAKRARDFASTLSSPEVKAAFLRLADRWETEAGLRSDEFQAPPSGRFDEA